MSKSLYLIGSLRNPDIPSIAQQIRKLGWDVFDDWYAAGPEADDYWRKYEEARGRTYEDALDNGYAARHVFGFDLEHIRRCSVGVLVLPAGRSGHLELGYMAGSGKHTVIVLPEDTDRWDVMYKFASKVVRGVPKLLEHLETFNVERSGYNDPSDGRSGRDHRPGQLIVVDGPRDRGAHLAQLRGDACTGPL